MEHELNHFGIMDLIDHKGHLMDFKRNYSPKTIGWSENSIMDCFNRVMEVEGFQEPSLGHLAASGNLDPNGI